MDKKKNPAVTKLKKRRRTTKPDLTRWSRYHWVTINGKRVLQARSPEKPLDAITTTKLDRPLEDLRRTLNLEGYSLITGYLILDPKLKAVSTNYMHLVDVQDWIDGHLK